MVHHLPWKQSSQCRSTTAPAGHILKNIRYIDHLSDVSHDVHLRPCNQSALCCCVPVTMGPSALSCRVQGRPCRWSCGGVLWHEDRPLLFGLSGYEYFFARA